MSSTSWNKLGLVIKPDKKLWWMQTHAMVPTLEKLSGSLVKVYFSGRDKSNRSHIGYAVIDLDSPTKIREFSSEPVLAPGALGCFDDNGVSPSCILKNGDKTHLYYIGWNPGSTTRMNIFGGLAISEDNGKTFQRYSRAPILERCRANPYINSAPWVVKESENDFSIYFVAGVEWIDRDHPRYNIQMGKSKNGCEFQRDGHVCIDFEGDEVAIARPYVVKEADKYIMWFAAKGKDTYRIKYAESKDGKKWQRKDELTKGLIPTNDSYDSEMMEYAVVLPHKGRRVMFYNGNNYGYDGIAVAVEE